MSALRDRRFRLLLTGGALSNFGDTALYLALAIWVKELTDSNGAAASVFLALGLPALLSPAGGHLVDRVRHRRRLLMTTDAVTGCVVLSLLFVHSRSEIWIIYAVAAAYGLSATVVGPATSGLMKDLLPDGELGSANAARQTLNQGLRLLAPLAGAGLYAAFGGGTVAVLDAVTFGCSILLVSAVRMTESPVENAADQPTFLRRVVAGFVHIRETPLLLRITVSTGVAMLSIGLFEPVVFAVIAAIHQRPSFLGVVVCVQGAGSILGGLAVTRVLHRLGEARTLGLGLAGLAVGAGGMVLPVLPLVLTCSGVLGVGLSFFVVAFGTAIQRGTPPRLLGRVSAASDVLTTVPQTMSIAVGAALINFVDYRILLGIIVTATLSCGVSLMRYGRRAVLVPAPVAVDQVASSS